MHQAYENNRLGISRHSGGVGERGGLSKEGKKEIRHSTGRPGWTQQWLRINIITVRFGCRDGRSTRAKYYIQMRAKAAPVSTNQKPEGFAVPRGQPAEVEGCRLTVETQRGWGIPFARLGQPRGHGNVPSCGLPHGQRKLHRLA